MIAPKEIIRSNRSSLALTINHEGDLIVRAPFFMPIEKIYSFINEKENWIKQKQSNIKQTLNDQSDVIEYNNIFFLGKKYQVVYIKGLDSPYLTNEYLAINYTKSLTNKKNQLKEFYYDNVESILLPRIKKMASKIGVEPTGIKIINSKAKWGMCDNNKQIYINWKLVMLSHELIDYVIVHELCHIKQLNHSSEFWKLVNKYTENCKEKINLLKKANFLIKLY